MQNKDTAGDHYLLAERAITTIEHIKTPSAYNSVLADVANSVHLFPGDFKELDVNDGHWFLCQIIRVVLCPWQDGKSVADNLKIFHTLYKSDEILRLTAIANSCFTRQLMVQDDYSYREILESIGAFQALYETASIFSLQEMSKKKTN